METIGLKYHFVAGITLRRGGLCYLWMQLSDPVHTKGIFRMNLDPFSKNGLGSPEGGGRSKSSTDEIFIKNKGGGAGRRAAPTGALEPMDIPSPELAPEPEKKKAAVVLRNPKWEAEKVGFNEEARISVELELPPELAHKTKVAFELFAKTPKGPERISQGEGKADGGKAIGVVPVYIPAYPQTGTGSQGNVPCHRRVA